MNAIGEHANKRRLMLIAALAAAAFIALDCAVTIAAFINISKNDFSLDYKTEAIGATYFNGGSGAESYPYKIRTPDHLRNLQKLTSLGLFNAATHFALETSFAWSGDPLLPIGSDDQPFDGVFDGGGYTITGLVVNGNNTWDIGMFGYVGVEGSIKNFFLNHPIIHVGANTNGGSADSTNPLHTYLKTAAQNLAVPSGKNGTTGIHWSNLTASSTISGFDTTLTASINGSDVSFPIDWQSSNDALLSLENGVWTTHATAGSQYPDTDIYTAMLTGRVYATVDGRTMPYTLERYEVNVLGNGLITDDKVLIGTGSGSTSTKVMKGIFKTLWPLDSNGTASSFHGTYVGFFCGHLDGFAQYLGLVGGNSYNTSSNGTITVGGRIATSSTTLIGRCRGDDVRDGTGSNQFGHTYDFTKNVTWTSFTPPSQNNYSSVSAYTTQENRMKALTDLYDAGASTTTYKYVRVYPGATHTTNLSYTYVDGNGVTQTATGVKALRMNGALAASTGTSYETKNYIWPTVNTNNDYDESHNPIYDEKDITDTSPTENRVNQWLNQLNTYYYQANMNLIRRYSVTNGFWVNTKGDSADVINTITGKNEFSLTFRITYLATTTSSNKSQNSWQILYNALNTSVHKFQPCYSDWYYYYGFIYNDSYLQNCLWYDLHNPYQYSTDTGDYDLTDSKYTPVPIIADGTLREADVTITVSRSSSFWSAWMENYFASDTWYPCFGIGMGADNSLAQRNPDGYTIWGGPFRRNSSTGTKSQRGPNDNSNHYYNSYFTLGSDISMNILSFQSIFTNADGNVSSLMSNVDYIYDQSGCTFDANTKTFTSWNRASGVKIGLNVPDVLTSGNAAYYFYREIGSSGVDSVVQARYSNSSYQPFNDASYKAATIGAAT